MACSRKLAVQWDDCVVRIFRAKRFLALFLLALALVVNGASAKELVKPVVKLELSGVVDPFEASHLSRNIASADPKLVSAVLVTIDTPGGLDSSMRKIVKSILASRVPVLCYVGPKGARAASAGTFVLMSCSVAAMAPGTNVGAAHPVGVSGAIEQRKVMNDAAAFLRSLAEDKGRNAEWAEKAVRRSVSASAEEALHLGVIDLVAGDEHEFLREADGSTVDVNGRDVTVQVAGASVAEHPLGLAWSLLHGLITPDFSFLFFYLGLILLVVEALHPGISVPGVVGALSMASALTGFGMLPVQLLGVLLLVASVVFFLLELKYPGLGVHTFGGLATLILGGLLLFNTSVPEDRVSPAVIAPVAIAAGLFFVFVVKAALKTRNIPKETVLERVVGLKGVVTTALDPVGVVQVRSEKWSARATGPHIPVGSSVMVVRVSGLMLEVEPISVESDLNQVALAIPNQQPKET